MLGIAFRNPSAALANGVEGRRKTAQGGGTGALSSGMDHGAEGNRIRTVSEVVKPIWPAMVSITSPRAFSSQQGHLAQVGGFSGMSCYRMSPKSASTGAASARQGDSLSGRTINMELGELGRLSGTRVPYCGRNVPQLEERTVVLFRRKSRKTFSPVWNIPARATRQSCIPLLLTGMTAGEALALTWRKRT